MRRSLLLVALLVLMSFPSVEAFAETIQSKGVQVQQLDTVIGQQAQNASLHLFQPNPAEGTVKNSSEKALIVEEEHVGGNKDSGEEDGEDRSGKNEDNSRSGRH